MLLYYFADKDELLTATLDRIARRMVVRLDHAIPVEPPRPFPVLLEQAWAALASESLRSFMPLWLELAASAARNLQPHREIAGEIADGFLAWVAIRLEPEGDSEPASLAPLFLASIEGMYLLEAIGRGNMADLGGHRSCFALSLIANGRRRKCGGSPWTRLISNSAKASFAPAN